MSDPGAAQPQPRARSAALSTPASTTGAASRRSPPDHVNPEAPWPQIERARARRPRRPAASAGRAADRLPALRRATRSAGSTRAAPSACCALADAEGLARDADWSAGRGRSRRRARRRRVRRRRALGRPPGRRRSSTERCARRALDEADDDRACSPRAAPPSPRSSPRRRRSCAASVSGDDGHLRRQPQHQLHQHLHLSLRLLRLLQGQHQGRTARTSPTTSTSRRSARRAREAGRARRDRGLPAGRHPSALHRRHLSRHPARR